MPFDISIGGDPRLTLDQQMTIRQAADRWSQIITGDLPDVNVPGIGVIDDIHINVGFGVNDGPGKTLAVGGFDAVRSDSLLPYLGHMKLDPDDLNNDFFDTVLHEMGHALGIGTLWAAKGLVKEVNAGDPRFFGPAAATEYGKLNGRSPIAVPLENDRSSADYGKHFRESVLDYELMTSVGGFKGMGAGTREPISGVTIGSLKDMGYQVNFAAADPFMPINPIV